MNAEDCVWMFPLEFLFCASIHLWWSCLAFTAEKQVTQLWSWWWSCWLWWWLMTDVHQSMTPNTLFRCVSISWIGFVLPSLHLSLFLGLKFMTYLDFEQTSLKCWCWCKSLRRKVLTNCSFSPRQARINGNSDILKIICKHFVKEFGTTALWIC